MAKEKAVNIASCLEKSEIVNAIISCQKKFELRHSTATSAVETIAVESSSSSSQESSDDSNQSSSDEHVYIQCRIRGLIGKQQIRPVGKVTLRNGTKF